MAALSCRSCGAAAEAGDLICLECGDNLTRSAPAEAPPDPLGDPLGPGASSPMEAPCLHCGAVVPDPANLICVTCLRPLRDRPAEPAPSSGEAAATRRDSAVIRLRFTTGEHTVLAGKELVLGRDPAVSPAAVTLASFDNVSRRHATVGLAPDGAGWVRDERSTNGTFVNGNAVPPGVLGPLRDGDVLRLAADVTAQVSLLRDSGAAR